jgi:hypothetical protein
MRLTLPDDLADLILAKMPVGTKAPLLEDVIIRVLTKALPLVEEGGLALSRDEVAKLADILLRPSLADGKAVLAAARDLHDLDIGRHRLKLQPAVLNELRSRAAREGKEFGQILQQTVDRIAQEVGVLL